MTRKISIKDHILQNINVDEVTGCWNWQKGCFTQGYGLIKINGKLKRVHRVAYEAFKGPIPEWLLICHSCDNPRCCNPKHLWVGTHQENSDDKWNKGREGNNHVPHPNADLKGSKGPNAKLTDEDVVEIRILLTIGKGQRIIAKQFGVTRATISSIKVGRIWNHLTI